MRYIRLFEVFNKFDRKLKKFNVGDYVRDISSEFRDVNGIYIIEKWNHRSDFRKFEYFIMNINVLGDFAWTREENLEMIIEYVPQIT